MIHKSIFAVIYDKSITGNKVKVILWYHILMKKIRTQCIYGVRFFEKIFSEQMGTISYRMKKKDTIVTIIAAITEGMCIRAAA